ncbi:MAG: tetratricopeptide repeat protein [Fibrobacter sp.]|nr:tetratricopeptide repeat protein [Fibrobacter sp.]
MNKLKKYLCLFSAGLVLIGCAGSVKQADKAILPEMDVETVTTNANEAVEIAKELKKEYEALAVKVAEFENRLIIISEEVANISSAKTEELEGRIALLIEAYKELNMSVNALKAIDTGSNAKSQKKQAMATFEPVSAAFLITSPEYELYQNGLRFFNSGNYVKAIEIFHDVINQFPSGDYTDKSHYWIGESYYFKADFPTAIASFSRVLSFKESEKHDDAQFKIGLSYLKMGQPKKAKETLLKLLEHYPNSEYAARTRRYLSEIE